MSINAVKRLSTTSSVMKQFYQLTMYYLFSTLRNQEDKQQLQKEIGRLVGYTSAESKRALADRYKKIQRLGELAEIFGSDIVFIPKLGSSIYNSMNEKERTQVRRNESPAGSSYHSALTHSLTTNPRTASLFSREFASIPLPAHDKLSLLIEKEIEFINRIFRNPCSNFRWFSACF